MTDKKPDWADEIAGKLAYGSGVEEIAPALRKAKADGIRYVIKAIDANGAGVTEASGLLKRIADKIERGDA